MFALLPWVAGVPGAPLAPVVTEQDPVGSFPEQTLHPCPSPLFTFCL